MEGSGERGRGSRGGVQGVPLYFSRVSLSSSFVWRSVSLFRSFKQSLPVYFNNFIFDSVSLALRVNIIRIFKKERKKNK